MANIGTQLPTPETGWKRITETEIFNSKKIDADNDSWSLYEHSSYYNKKFLQCLTPNKVLTFYVKCTDFRFISSGGTSRATDSKIFIDGEEFDSNLSTYTNYICVLFEKTNMENTIHEVKLVAGTNNNYKFILDAIDIDSDGYLLTEEEYLAKIKNSVNFPVKVGGDSIVSETNVANYAKTLTNGERQLLLLKTGDMYLTDGNGGYIKIIDENTTNHINREVLDLLSTDGESLYFNGKNIQKIELEDGQYGYSATFMNVAKDSIYTIDISNGSGLSDQIVQVWEFEEGDTDITTVAKTFNNAFADNFYYDKDNTEFNDTVCKIKDEFILENELDDIDGYYESNIINKDDFLELIGFYKDNNKNNEIYNYGITNDNESGVSKSYTTSKGVIIESDYTPYDGNYSISNMIYSNTPNVFLTAETPDNNKYINITLPEKVFIYNIETPSLPYSGWFSTGEILDDNNDILGTFDTNVNSVISVNKMINKIKIRFQSGGAYGVSFEYLKIHYSDDLYLIKQNNLFYSIGINNYNQDTMQFNPITLPTVTNMFSNIELLNNEVTVDTETFKPIDKFNNFQLVSLKKDSDLKIQGLKSNKQLIVARYSFSTRLVRNIDFFELISNISDTSSIKMAVSVDEGLTWKTWSESGFIDLINTCPLKEYSALSEDEKVQWNTFKDEVYASGINGKTLNTVDFNSIKEENMMFAYVFNRDSYEDKCEMSKLQYQFDAKGSYILLKDSEVDIKQNSEVIGITPKNDMELMKVNVGSSGEVNIIQNGGTTDIDLPTDTEVDNMISGVIGNVFN